MEFIKIQKKITEYKCKNCQKINSKPKCNCSCSNTIAEDYSKCQMRQHIKITKYDDMGFKYAITKYGKCIKCNQIGFVNNQMHDVQEKYIKENDKYLFILFDSIGRS